MAANNNVKKTSDKKIKDLNPYGFAPYGVYNRYEEYFNLLMNAVKIIKKTNDEEGDQLNYAVETFVKTQLFEDGAVGFDSMTALTNENTEGWYIVEGVGINELGNPLQLILRSRNGLVSYTRQASYKAKEDGAFIIKALPNGLAISKVIKETTDFMTNCDVAMRQNLEACKSPYIVVCKNEDLRLSYEQAIQQKQSGQAVVLVSEELGDGLKAVNVACEFLVDRFSEVRDKERDTLLNKLGIMTANINKKERVQSAEVNATIGQATDYIYLLIDTFNKQMESYNLPYEMKLNGSLEDLYVGDLDDEDVDVNNIEKEQAV